ncbi:hypothetical protein MJ575_24845 [Klebsiella pneumoniae]|nr:hypothetical protein MJ575_24845 [Klebsiella pneumoniae]
MAIPPTDGGGQRLVGVPDAIALRPLTACTLSLEKTRSTLPARRYNLVITAANAKCGCRPGEVSDRQHRGGRYRSSMFIRRVKQIAAAWQADLPQGGKTSLPTLCWTTCINPMAIDMADRQG